MLGVVLILEPDVLAISTEGGREGTLKLLSFKRERDANLTTNSLGLTIFLFCIPLLQNKTPPPPTHTKKKDLFRVRQISQNSLQHRVCKAHSATFFHFGRTHDDFMRF